MAEVRINLTDTLHGHVALTAAASAGHVDVCRVLIRRGANIRVTNLKVFQKKSNPRKKKKKFHFISN